MMKVDLSKRITIPDALNHPWIKMSKPGLKQEHQKMTQATIDKLKSFRGESLLRRATLNILIKQIDSAKLEHLKQTFEYFDKDNSGFIDYNNMKQVLENLNKEMDSSEFE